jgi:hypothetical protein
MNRLTALRCLSTVAEFSSKIVAQQRAVVLRELMSVLDDKKRLVRKEAVRTRSIW